MMLELERQHLTEMFAKLRSSCPGLDKAWGLHEELLVLAY